MEWEDFLKDCCKHLGVMMITSETLKTRGVCIKLGHWVSTKREVLEELTQDLNLDPNCSATERFYLLLNNIQEIPKCHCGNNLKFLSISRGYSISCSHRCSQLNTETREKIKRTTQDRFGVDNVSRSKTIKEKKRNTMRQNYGVDFPFQSEEVKKKFRENYLKFNGVDNPSKLDEIKDKKKETSLKNYGECCSLKSPEVREKIRKTNLKKYGTENPMQNPEVVKQFKLKYQERTGYKNPFQNPDVKEKIKETCKIKYGAEYFSSSKENKDVWKNKMFYRLLETDRLKNMVFPLFQKTEYRDVTKKYMWKCNTCGHQFEDHLNDGRVPRCPMCFPSCSSIPESEIFGFLLLYSKNTKRGDRKVLSGLEIDILLPDQKIGIEFDGLYWHSESNHTDNHYHLDKTNLAKSKGIQLIHIFEDEWIEKQDIVKSILLAKMGKIDNKIAARKCIIRTILNKEAKQFLFDNHLQGSINGRHFGLYYEEKLVSLLTMGKPRFNKKYDWEILRFCCKNFTIVQGGLSKLLNYFEKNNSGTIITYVDRRYGSGLGYQKSGFKKVGETNPNYYYLSKGFTYRESRMKYQKHKLPDLLENFDPELTEWENMQLNGYSRIWDCGNLVYEKI